MKLLILTQKVSIDDDVLGFMHRWIVEFARHVEFVTVICLHAERYAFPANVRVISMGKEGTIGAYLSGRQDLLLTTLRRLIYSIRFYWYVLRERNRYDTVFVHMNHEYIVLAGLLWRIMGKRISLWYAHGATPWTLRVAIWFAHDIFTSTTSGFRLATNKLHVVGQGIDTEQFNASTHAVVHEPFHIMSVGRISPVKDYATLLCAAAMLRDEGKIFRIAIIGQLGRFGQERYFEDLQKQIRSLQLESFVYFVGAVPNRELPVRLLQADLFVNMSHTGSLDKAMLEAMACGLPLVTCNESMKEVLGLYIDQLMYFPGDARALADKIVMVMNMSLDERRRLGLALRAIVVRDHNVQNFIHKIVKVLVL